MHPLPSLSWRIDWFRVKVHPFPSLSWRIDWFRVKVHPLPSLSWRIEWFRVKVHPFPSLSWRSDWFRIFLVLMFSFEVSVFITIIVIHVVQLGTVHYLCCVGGGRLIMIYESSGSSVLLAVFCIPVGTKNYT